jgi:F0F1-type ATP synthase assembly protein I
MGLANKPNPSNNYLKYGGLAFQLLGGIGASGWLGYLLDRYLAFTFPVFMLTFGLLFFVGMIYQLYRTIHKP